MSNIQNLTPYHDQTLGIARLKAQNVKSADSLTIMQSMRRNTILAEIRVAAVF